jgi:Vitamin K-dependent gamma-carboxylase
MRETSASPLLSRDFQSLSLFRIAFSAYLLIEFLINGFPVFASLYGPDGILPARVLAEDSTHPGMWLFGLLFRAVDLLRPQLWFPWLYIASILWFCIGYRTRLGNAVLFALHSYLYWRNPLITSGAENLSRLALLWCLFLPMARYWSVDAAMDPKPRDRHYPGLPFVAIRLQLCSVYVFAALFKLLGEPWRDGSAIALALSDTLYGNTALGMLLVEHAPGLLHVATYAVTGFQLALPLLLYAPWRNELFRFVALAGALGLHVSFILCLNIGGFPYLSLVLLLLFIPDTWVDRALSRKRQALRGVQIYYEPDCGFCRRISLLLREFCLTPAVRVVPASLDAVAQKLLQDHGSWVVRDANGQFHLKWRAVAYVFKQNVLFAPIGWFSDLPTMRPYAERLYDLIGRSRHWLGPFAARLLPSRSERAPRQPALIVCAALMGFAVVANTASVASAMRGNVSGVASEPSWLDHLTAILQVKQSWPLFAPVPVHFAWTYQILAHAADGSTIDLMRARPVSLMYASDDGGSVEFASFRWQKHLGYIGRLSSSQWSALGSFVCRVLRQTNGPGADTRSVEIVITTQPRIATVRGIASSSDRRQFECAS